MHRGGEGRGRRGFAGACLEADAELLHDVAGVGKHVHQVRDGRTLVSGDVADAALEERLGDGKDALAAKLLAGADPELLDFLGERTLGHSRTLARRMLLGGVGLFSGVSTVSARRDSPRILTKILERN